MIRNAQGYTGKTSEQYLLSGQLSRAKNVYCEEQDFHKNFPCLTKRMIAATRPRVVSPGLVALPPQIAKKKKFQILFCIIYKNK